MTFTSPSRSHLSILFFSVAAQDALCLRTRGFLTVTVTASLVDDNGRAKSERIKIVETIEVQIKGFIMGGTLLHKDLDSAFAKVSEETRRSVRVSELGNSGHRLVDRDFNVDESSLKRVQALKKFVEENHRLALALEFDKLVVQFCQLENECRCMIRIGKR
ncbi:hypothetical protein V8G54_023384 [Vigna mungo]|uniref:Uncharacterized protein n=1 Tax=Vigna mungo TaxID=3915 RepID=A0AAQ3N5B1_VIGMU